METSLHRALKERYAEGGRTEAAVEGFRFRVDAVSADGTVVEVQSGALGPLWPKLDRLLASRKVIVVKPVVLSRRVVRRTRPDSADLSARRSPWRGALVDVFDDLIGLARIFPHPNLGVDVLGVEIEEVRVCRRRRPGYAVVDRRLVSMGEPLRLSKADDLWALLPETGDEPFTTTELAEALGRPRPFAQRVAYCLRLSGAATVVGKRGNRLVYVRESSGVTAGLAEGMGGTDGRA